MMPFWKEMISEPISFLFLLFTGFLMVPIIMTIFYYLTYPFFNGFNKES
jgi:hypothetical protein